jgi:hypothetical protein
VAELHIWCSRFCSSISLACRLETNRHVPQVHYKHGGCTHGRVIGSTSLGRDLSASNSVAGHFSTYSANRYKCYSPNSSLSDKHTLFFISNALMAWQILLIDFFCEVTIVLR